MGEAPAPVPPASTPLAAREKPSLRRWLATHKLQACALCFMVMSIALYFLVQAFAAGGALGAALAVGFGAAVARRYQWGVGSGVGSGAGSGDGNALGADVVASAAARHASSNARQ